MDNSDNMSNASLGTAAAFKNDVGVGGLFLKDGEYNIEFLQTFITKPLNTKRAAMKPLRQAVAYKEVPGFKPRTVIYFKKPSLERDEQQREKFNLLSKEEQDAVEAQSHVTKKEVRQCALFFATRKQCQPTNSYCPSLCSFQLYQETKKVRKAWNTPAERPGTLPKPPPRVSLEERKARKAKAEAELENRGALVETVTVPDPR